MHSYQTLRDYMHSSSAHQICLSKIAMIMLMKLAWNPCNSTLIVLELRPMTFLKQISLDKVDLVLSTSLCPTQALINSFLILVWQDCFQWIKLTGIQVELWGPTILSLFRHRHNPHSLCTATLNHTHQDGRIIQR
ncbi:hypothetical protein FCV25MIE_32318 [Fagus crenata]